MKRSWCVPALLVAAGSAACVPGSPAVLPSVALRAPATIRVQVAEGGAIRRVPLEEYVLGTILSEFSPASGDVSVVGRMLDVQAVIGRTYAVAHLGRHATDGFDVCATTHCQLFEPSRMQTSRWAPAAAEAVRRTVSTVLWYGTDPASALFHADCGGRTSGAETVWGGRALPYLAGVTDEGPASPVHTAWRYEATREQVRLALNATATTRVGDRLDRIDIRERDAAGRITRIALEGRTGRTVRGEEFRAALTRVFGARTIRSTRFDIRRNGASFVFDGRGFGHGVGLCQAGALARIRAGDAMKSVLGHYYPGTKLVVMR
jgi:stage II sporulation protein D